MRVEPIEEASSPDGNDAPSSVDGTRREKAAAGDTAKSTADAATEDTAMAEEAAAAAAAAANEARLAAIGMLHIQLKKANNLAAVECALISLALALALCPPEHTRVSPRSVFDRKPLVHMLWLAHAH